MSLKILDRTGHTVLETDTDEAIAFAETQFKEKKKDGYLAYDVSKTPAETIHKFDPEVDTLMSPPNAGG